MTPDERAVALEEDEAVRFRASLVVSGQLLYSPPLLRMDTLVPFQLDAAQAVATREGQTAVLDIGEAVNAQHV